VENGKNGVLEKYIGVGVFMAYTRKGEIKQ